MSDPVEEGPNVSDLKDLYRQMSDHTKDECGKCNAPHSCCSPEYCEQAIRVADHVGEPIQIPEGHRPQHNGNGVIPLLGTEGCIAEPHLRPLCTLHTCDINAFGFKRGDQEWTDRYFQIRDQIDDSENRLEGFPV